MDKTSEMLLLLALLQVGRSGGLLLVVRLRMVVLKKPNQWMKLKRIELATSSTTDTRVVLVGFIL